MLQAGLYRYWLQGPIVTAVIIEDRNARSADVNTDGGTGDPLHPIFEAWFYPQGSKVQVGFTLENAWASSTSTQSARNQTFALTLQTGYNSLPRGYRSPALLNGVLLVGIVPSGSIPTRHLCNTIGTRSTCLPPVPIQTGI